MPEYSPAIEAKKIAEKLIRKHHDTLEDVRIEYVFRDKASKKNGKTVYGQARKIGGLNAYLATPDVISDVDDFFVIEFARDVWSALSKEQRIALVDHELCHCTTEVDDKTGDLKLVLRPHDLEEFREIVERHGLWDNDLEFFAKTLEERMLEEVGQLSLDDAAAAS